MRLRDRLRSALAASGLAHALTSLCALTSALTLASGTTAMPLAEPVHVGELYTLMRLLDSASTSPLRYGLMPGLLLLAAAPFMSVIWLRAQLSAASLPSHARAVAPVYLQALTIHVLGLAYSALLIGLGSLLGYAASKLLVSTHDLRVQQTAAWLVAAPCVLAALVHAPCVSDRAQLELALGTRAWWPAVLRALRAVDLRSCGLRAACQLAVCLLALLALLPRLWLGSHAFVALLLTSQLSALGQTAVRASWLAWLTQQAERYAYGDARC